MIAMFNLFESVISNATVKRGDLYQTFISYTKSNEIISIMHAQQTGTYWTGIQTTLSSRLISVLSLKDIWKKCIRSQTEQTL